MAADVLAAFTVVFLAELGDKTQLVALTLAGRYPAVKVLAALGAAILVLQTLSVTAGAMRQRSRPGTGHRRRGRRAVPRVRRVDLAVRRVQDDDEEGVGGRAGLSAWPAPSSWPSSATRRC